MCWICTRRHFLAGSISAIFATGSGETAPAQEFANLCALGNADLSGLPRRRWSDDDALDKALISELKEIRRTLHVRPAFQYILEDTENAGALPDPPIVVGTRGTVLIGLKLVKTLMEQKKGAAVAGICAHECGHIFQFVSGHGFFAQLCTNGFHNVSIDCRRALELHADFIAGYYMGRRRDWAEDKLKEFREAIIMLAEMRGFRNGDQTSHGTLEQRVKAINKGYTTASDRLTFDQDVAIIGESYVTALLNGTVGASG